MKTTFRLQTTNMICKELRSLLMNMVCSGRHTDVMYSLKSHLSIFCCEALLSSTSFSLVISSSRAVTSSCSYTFACCSFISLNISNCLDRYCEKGKFIYLHIHLQHFIHCREPSAATRRYSYVLQYVKTREQKRLYI